MAIAKVQSVQALIDGLSSTISINFTAATAGHLLLAICAPDKITGTFTYPSGWTPIGTAHDTGPSVGLALAYKVATGGETSVAFSWAGSASKPMALMYEFSGVDTTSPINQSIINYVDDTNVNSRSTGTTSATTVDNCLAVAICCIDTWLASASSRTWTNSFVEDYFYTSNTTGAEGIDTAFKVITPVGTAESTFSWVSAADQAIGAMVVLAPAAITGPPAVTTTSASSISTTTATSGGNVTTANGFSVTARGVCWSSSPGPTTSSSHTTDGTGTGSFTSSITGLALNTTYYYRAYATNSAGTSYGSELSFTTGAIAIVQQIGGVSEIFIGTFSVTLPSPATAGNLLLAFYAPDKAPGAFTYPSGWTALAGEHNNGPSISFGWAYKIAVGGESVITFSTTVTTVSKPALFVMELSGVDPINPINQSIVNYVDDATVLSRSSGTTSATTIASCLAIAVFCTDTWLNVSGSRGWSNGFSEIYAQAFTSSGPAGIDVGTKPAITLGTAVESTFTYTGGADQAIGAMICINPVPSSPVNPILTTTTVTSIGTTTATSGGNISYGGGATVTARGVCWSTSANPTVSNSHTSDGTGTGSFSSALTGLSLNTTYHVRSYATNSAGTGYGADTTFTTRASLSAPTVTTAAITNVTGAAATSGGNVTDDGGATVIDRGICWDVVTAPTIDDVAQASGTGVGSFVANLSGLTIGVTYYVRAYAANNVGTSYGSEFSFVASNSFALDALSVAAAIGLSCARKLKSTFAGSPIRVRRSSDNTEQDIGFDGSGALDETALLAFVGAGNGFVTKLYDQSGNARHAVQATQATQPQIVASGVVNKRNSRPTMTFSGSQGVDAPSVGLPYGSSARSLNAVYKPVSRDQGVVGYGTSTDPQNFVLYNYSNSDPFASSYGNDAGSGFAYDGLEKISTITYNGTAWSTFKNGTAGNTATTGISTVQANPFSVGLGTGGWTPYQGEIQEVILTADQLSTPDRQSLERSQATFYSITLPTAVAAITTNVVSSVTSASAVCGGVISADNNSAVTDRGIVWSTSANPTTSDNKISLGSGVGSFTGGITGLSNGVTYHVRAYAVNGVGTAYGVDRSFTAMSAINAVQIFNIFPPTQTSITANIQLTVPSSDVRIKAYRASDSGLEATSAPTVLDVRMVCKITLNGLTPGTSYNFRVVADGIEDTNWTSTNKTEWLQDGQAHTYKIFLSGDCRRPSVYGGTLDTFTMIALWGANTFITVGDFPYCDITDYNPDAFAAAAEEIQHSTQFKAFSKQHAWTYMFDNHDSNTGYPEGGNPSIPAARQEWTRYNPIGVQNEANTLSYFYKKGRIYHIVPDLRSNKYHSVPQIMSPTTLQMIKDVISLAALQGCGVAMHSSTPYCSVTLADDDWSNYGAQRDAIHDHLRLKGMQSAFVVVHNDAHMIGFDDGIANTSAHYGTSSPFGVPVWCAAAVHSQASLKGSQTYRAGQTYASGLLWDISEPAYGPITVRGRLIQDNQTVWRDDTILLSPPRPTTIQSVVNGISGASGMGNF